MRTSNAMLVMLVLFLALPLFSGVAAAASASRSLPASAIDTGANFDVGVSVSGYGAFGQVTETLPAGFSYVSSNLDPSQVAVSGNTVAFTLMGDTGFTYTAKAPGTAGTYTFSGILRDADRNQIDIGGNVQAKVVKSPDAQKLSGGGAGTIPAETQQQTDNPAVAEPGSTSQTDPRADENLDVPQVQDTDISSTTVEPTDPAATPVETVPQEPIESGLIGLFALLILALIHRFRA